MEFLSPDLAYQMRESHTKGYSVATETSEIQNCVPIVWILIRLLNEDRIILYSLSNEEHSYQSLYRERSGSVTRDRGAMGSSLMGITALCP